MSRLERQRQKTEGRSVMHLVLGSIFTTVATLVVVMGRAVMPAAADPATGEQLARQWCSPCHIVASDQTRGSADVPSFANIARMPGFDRNKVAFFLLDPHPKMPSMSLTRREASDLADYIASLGTAR
jgi:mono/diheme cytochrome c family protein